MSYCGFYVEGKMLTISQMIAELKDAGWSRDNRGNVWRSTDGACWIGHEPAWIAMRATR